jgi:hypothetical protein
MVILLDSTTATFSDGRGIDKEQEVILAQYRWDSEVNFDSGLHSVSLMLNGPTRSDAVPVEASLHCRVDLSC